MAAIKIRGAIYKKRGEKKKWQGNYVRYKKARTFNLVPVEGKGSPKKFKSPADAKKAGYRIVAK